MMLKHYLLAFLVGWAFNFAIEVGTVTRSTMTWLQTGWFAPFFESGAPAPKTATKRS